MNVIPLALYVVAFVAYLWHFARRQPAVGRAATTLLVAATLTHTFVVGMQTMEAGHVPVTNTSSAISTVVWLLALAYLYTEMTTDERAMGTFILPLLIGAAAPPGAPPRRRGPRAGAAGAAVRTARAVAALCVRELRAGVRHRCHLRAALQGDQGQASRLFLRPSAVAAGARHDEPAHDRVRVDVSDDRHRGRHDLGGSGPGLRAGRFRVQAMSLQDPKIFVALVCWAVYSFEVFAARRMGWGGRRTAYLSALGFAIVLLNFVPISLFPDDEPQLLGQNGTFSVPSLNPCVSYWSESAIARRPSSCGSGWTSRRMALTSRCGR